MARSGKSLEEVRSILGRLDRSIDEARRRRLGVEDEDQPTAVGAQEPEPTFGVAEPEPAAEPEPVSETRARYGKAKPLGRPTNPAPDNLMFGVRRPDQRAS